MIFLDTSAVLALLNDQDRFHGAALTALGKIDADGETLLTHNYAIVEAVALIQRRLGLAAAVTFQLDAQSSFRIHWITEADHQQAVRRWTERATRRLNLVDCMSFIVMEMYGCTTAFTYDSDFGTEGFKQVG